MTTLRRQALLTAFKLFDLGVMAVSFTLAALPVSYFSAGVSFTSFLSLRVKMRNLLLFLLLVFLWHLVFTAVGLYQSKRLGGRKKETLDVLKATLVGTLLLTLAALWWRVRMVTPLFVLSFFVLSSSITGGSRLLLRSFLTRVRRHGRNLREVVIVGTNPRAVSFARTLENKPELGYRLLGFVDQDWPGIREFRASGYPLIADLEHFPHLLREHVIDEVALALPMRSLYPQASRVAAHCEEQGIIVRQVVNLFDLRLAKAKADQLGHEAVVTIYSSPIESWAVVMKHLLDIAASVAALVGLAPVFLITSLLIALDSPGPVLFSQERLGLNKRRFRMYKFRTMVADAEKKQAELESLNESDGPVFKIKDDPRVTRVGKFLRKFSIDELPQFFNVLRGDMSLVGPRPLPIRDYQGFDQDRQRRRFSVRPGLTCLWQINGRSSVSFEHWMDMDMQYIDHWSLWLDLKILAKTIPAVLRGTGAA
jgi:exopolysaccharide biosynthesis polyprenyl glycosylphosphotransferase